MKSSFLFRSRILFICILLFALILVGKLFVVQVVEHNAYTQLANHQYATPAGNIYERGSIFFASKDGTEVTAATQVSGFKLAIDPSKLINPENVYTHISPLLTTSLLSHDDFIADATKAGATYAEVAHRLTKEQADAVSALKIPGLSIYQEKWRFYPGDSLAAQTLGFVGYTGNTLSGVYGIERQYNNVLSRATDNPYVNFFAEVFSNLGKTLFQNSNDTKEGDVVTTIEPTVQSFLEQELQDVRTKYNPDSIGGIIMNPQDGSIYAMALNPTFDLNDFSQVKTSTFSDPLVENVYEFGSVVKPLVMAAALDMGVVTPQTTYDDKGSVVIDGHTIYNFDKRGRGPGTTMQDVLNQSLNTGMVFVEQQLGKVNLRNYLLSYGIGDKTGIDLPNETSGLISNILTSPRDIEYANAAFGQGIALTPIELIRAEASIANGGNLVTPHVVQKIQYDDGTEKDFTYPTTRVKFSQATATETAKMMVTVMDTAIEGGIWKSEPYSVAVKTGTAQIADPATGGYYANEDTHSFIGFFPAFNPKFIIFLYAVNPKGVEYSATTWSDPFLAITKFLLNYYEIPPDR